MINHRCAIDLFGYCASPDLQVAQEVLYPDGTYAFTAGLTCPNSPPECPHYRTFTQTLPPLPLSLKEGRTTIEI